MPITLPPLPYDYDALAPHISAETLHFHYDKHHKGYVDNLNKLIEGSPLARLSLEDIIAETRRDARQTGVFNNAAQIWNHTFYWRSMRPAIQGSKGIPAAVADAFGGADAFEQAFIDIGKKQFGSGWVWLVAKNGKLDIVSTSNADLPMIEDGANPLLVSDVWEHAYYIDYRNDRAKYLKTFIDNLANWKFVEENLGKI